MTTRKIFIDQDEWWQWFGNEKQLSAYHTETITVDSDWAERYFAAKATFVQLSKELKDKIDQHDRESIGKKLIATFTSRIHAQQYGEEFIEGENTRFEIETKE